MTHSRIDNIATRGSSSSSNSKGAGGSMAAAIPFRLARCMLLMGLFVSMPQFASGWSRRQTAGVNPNKPALMSPPLPRRQSHLPITDISNLTGFLHSPYNRHAGGPSSSTSLLLSAEQIQFDMETSLKSHAVPPKANGYTVSSSSFSNQEDDVMDKFQAQWNQALSNSAAVTSTRSGSPAPASTAASIESPSSASTSTVVAVTAASPSHMDDTHASTTSSTTNLWMATNPTEATTTPTTAAPTTTTTTAVVPPKTAMPSPPPVVQTKQSSSVASSSPPKSNSSANKASSAVKDTENDFDARLTDTATTTAFSKNWDQIVHNIVNGGADLGNRGEIFVLGQIAISVVLIMGSATFPTNVGEPLEIVLGPTLGILGLVAAVAASIELGPSLSPWAVPANIYRDLVVTGPFAYVRHPLYAGLLAMALGLSLATHSTVRILATLVLWYILERQTEYEEEQLSDIYPEYRVYRRTIKGKFWPQENVWETLTSQVDGASLWQSATKGLADTYIRETPKTAVSKATTLSTASTAAPTATTVKSSPTIPAMAPPVASSSSFTAGATPATTLAANNTSATAATLASPAYTATTTTVAAAATAPAVNSATTTMTSTPPPAFTPVPPLTAPPPPPDAVASAATTTTASTSSGSGMRNYFGEIWDTAKGVAAAVNKDASLAAAAAANAASDSNNDNAGYGSGSSPSSSASPYTRSDDYDAATPVVKNYSPYGRKW